MTCIKTGCHVFLTEYAMWAYGDAFKIKHIYIFRLCELSYAPLRDVKHFTVTISDYWFDQGTTSEKHNSNLISTSVVDHGYDGVPV